MKTRVEADAGVHGGELVVSQDQGLDRRVQADRHYLKRKKKIEMLFFSKKGDNFEVSVIFYEIF